MCPKKTTQPAVQDNSKSDVKSTQAKIPKDGNPETIDPEVIEGLPPEIKKVFEFGMLQMRSGPHNPIMDKLEPQHIDKILSIAEKDEEHSDKQTTKRRRYNLVYVLLGISVFIFLIVYLIEIDKELLLKILAAITLFGAGFGGGYGYRYLRSESE